MSSAVKLLIFCAALLLGGCASVEESSRRYVELRVASKAKMQVLVYADQWSGLLTIHGFGGMAHNLHYWATLDGVGPEFRDPVLTVNSDTQFKHRGIIRVDQAQRLVVIDMVRVVSKQGEPEVTEASPANGTYPIKRTTQEPFIHPE